MVGSAHPTGLQDSLAGNRAHLGLDAVVCCDCFERGKLLVPPRSEWNVYVDETGERACNSADMSLLNEFAVWSWKEACEHEWGHLVHHYLGNIALVAFFREALAPFTNRFPLILKKVTYNGTHAGDYLSLTDVEQLRVEMTEFSQVHRSDPRDEEFLRNFERQLRELADASLAVKKPILF